ncbi:uncharacterized protein F5Z01DRAFT_669133 [Emericellopsis atlantica]|uniref:Uncharacterized protein n=1 Tax=Emericellopsis atlantica TaxID=2614577 RepID=A0A9P7ZCP9_9HYPO|nr:uncharacterized protein F5Z01DRAFT_669133 [Emericellopsis atlantica]KAG9249476.1 hypothetical protein F5Z01DRAFT_669133 [Emericellopsis atlantica]
MFYKTLRYDTMEALPYNIKENIIKYLSPLKRLIFPKWLNKHQFSTSAIWGMIFETEDWIELVYKNDNPNPGSPVVCLLGDDLNKLYSAERGNGAYLTLLVNDWSGDIPYHKETFFASLKKHTYDKQWEEIILHESGLRLQISDAVRSLQHITLQDPSRLFNESNGVINSSVLYYGSDFPTHLGGDQIKGVEGFPLEGKKFISEICMVKLRFRAGEAVANRFFIREGSKQLVVCLRRTNKDKDSGDGTNVVGFRVGRIDEAEAFRVCDSF